MRLVCPNCDAEYEVDDTAIPKGGRDVQCSNCGHAWFQNHPEVEAEQEAEEDLYEPPAGAMMPAVEEPAPVVEAAPEAEPEPVPEPVTVPEPVSKAEPVADVEPAMETEPDTEVAEMAEAEAVAKPELEGAGDAEPVLISVEEPVAATAETGLIADPEDTPPPVITSVPQRSLDETVLAVLREEAEREAAARKAEAAHQPVIETQTEMPLPQDNGMAAAVRRIARLRGAASEPEPIPEPVTKSRGEMLPAIEEINSTLRSTSDRTSDEDSAIVDTMVEEKPAGGGFRGGFTLFLVLAVVIVVLYVAAPTIGAKVPALDGAAKAYVAAIDAARVWLDASLKSLVATLRGYGGDTQG
ncbi:MAG: zinc-ribbon domain-containing protein [bacterium]